MFHLSSDKPKTVHLDNRSVLVFPPPPSNHISPGNNFSVETIIASTQQAKWERKNAAKWHIINQTTYKI
jgi:hypothetical protein